MTNRTSLRAGVAVLSATEVWRGVEIEWDHGLIARMDRVPVHELSPSEASRVVTPGLINAHTHLDLGALEGHVPPSDGFQGWVAALVEARAALSSESVEDGIERSARALAGTGTTTVVDVDSCGRTAPVLRGLGLRAAVLVEVLDGSPAGFSSRSASQLAAAQAALNVAPGPSDLIQVGLSPHGTHTVGDELMARIAAHCERPGAARVPIAIHWAETPGETQWLLHGDGPFAGWLGPSPHLCGTERLMRAGLLKGALLIHGNDPQAGEPERIAAAGGAVVHCPGSHRFFDRAPFPLARYVAAGVPVILGTDSWASNASLDMRRELRLLRETLGVGAQAAWRMATEDAARFLPWEHVTGRLEIGAAADFAVFEPRFDSQPFEVGDTELLESLTTKEPDVVETWVDGVQIG